jgi:predicted HAD superfamily Cof-like phosphohydrolase
MTKLEQNQQELIDLLTHQVADLSMMSKIELGDDVIFQIRVLQDRIKSSKTSVPFVDEVEEFNKTFGKPVNYEPTIPERKEWMFVYDFIREELEEYKEACEKGDIVEVLDALCDITYVSLANGALLHGLKNKILQAYAEVQASNMSKACQTEEDAIATTKSEALRIGEETYYEQVGDKWVVYRKSDKKVLKSLKYFRPDLSQFFTEEQLNKFNRIK